MKSEDVKLLMEWLSKFPYTMQVNEILQVLENMYQSELAKEKNLTNRKVEQIADEYLR